MLESVQHLPQPVPASRVLNVPAATAMHQRFSADLKALDNSFLVAPAASQIEAMLQAARARHCPPPCTAGLTGTKSCL
jgi:hypothetical protein